MNILVTGGAGFIGSHVAEAFLAEGRSVSVIDDLSTGKEGNLPPGAMFLRADIRDAGAVERLFAGGRFDVVCHHAAQMDVRRSVADPVFDASVNLVGVLTLLEAAVRHGVKKVLFASTGGAMYGEQDYFPADENHPARPVSPYGVAKLATEQYLFYYRAAYGLDYVSLRYANVYGPRQNPEGEAGVIAIFTDKMLRGEQPIINGDGRQTRDYVYVGDVVRANLLALRHKGSGVFNIGAGVETDVNALFRHLKVLTGSGCAEKHGEGKKGEQLRSVLDAGLAIRELGWSATHSLEEGLRLTVEYFRQLRGHHT
jgi:UDP-glucose 4-epimerase